MFAAGTKMIMWEIEKKSKWEKKITVMADLDGNKVVEEHLLWNRKLTQHPPFNQV